MAGPGLTLLAIALAGVALSPAEPPALKLTTNGMRVESESITAPTTLAKCITYNVSKKMPDLHVRNRTNDTTANSILLILANAEPTTTTFGVIRIDESESGSHLTTWLPQKSIAVATSGIASKLIGGC